MSDHDPVLADQSESFVSGFEAGRFFERLLDGDGFSMVIRESSMDAVRLLSASRRRRVIFASADMDGWVNAIVSDTPAKLSLASAGRDVGD